MGGLALSASAPITSPRNTVCVAVSIVSTTRQQIYAHASDTTGILSRTDQATASNLLKSFPERNPKVPMMEGSLFSARTDGKVPAGGDALVRVVVLIDADEHRSGGGGDLNGAVCGASRRSALVPR